MRTVFFLVAFVVIQNSTLYSNPLKKAINALETKHNQQAIQTIQEYLAFNPQALIPYKKRLNRKVNKWLYKEQNFESCYLALQLCQKNYLKLNPSNEQILLDKHQRLITQEHNLEYRALAGLILDLAGYMQSRQSIDILHESLSQVEDEQLKLFAALSLLRRGYTLSGTLIEDFAAQDQFKEHIFESLKSMDLLELLPEENQEEEALSRANMINWLNYPTELNKAPDSIALVKKITIKCNREEANFYLWKFKSKDEAWIEKNWMVGLSGPYSASEKLNAIDCTFSIFKGLEEQSPEHHFWEIIRIIKEAQEMED